MSRIETIGDATLYLGDCREILPTLGKIDAAVTDPPYGIFKLNGAGGYMKDRFYDSDNPFKWDRIDQSVMRLIVEHAGDWIIWGGNYHADTLGPCRAPLVWDKQTGANNFADGEIAFTSLSGTLRIFRHQWCGIYRASEHHNQGHKTEHPTQKPIALMQWCIGMIPKAKSIMDPLMGSGTTGVAAIKLGRRFIGIEIEPKYFDIACRRIDEASRQKDLFIETKDDAIATTIPELLL